MRNGKNAKHTVKVNAIGRYSYHVICMLRILPPAQFHNRESKVRKAPTIRARIRKKSEPGMELVDLFGVEVVFGEGHIISHGRNFYQNFGLGEGVI